MKRALLLALLAAAGCKASATAVVVSITTDNLVVPADLDAVRITIHDHAQPANVLAEQSLPVCAPNQLDSPTRRCFAFPITFSVIPGSQRPRDAVVIEVDAQLQGRPVLADATTFTFVEGTIQSLDFVLYRACVGKLDCAAGEQTCGRSGTCQSLALGPLHGFDAGVPIDLAGVDGPAPFDLAGADLNSQDLLAPSDLLIPPNIAVAHYRMEDGTDRSGFGNTLIARGAASFGVPGWAGAGFAPKGAFADAADSASLHVQNVTLEAWVNVNAVAAAGQILIEKGGDWQLAIDGMGHPLFNMLIGSSSGGCVSPTAISPGGWHHLAGTWDGVYCTLYQDGRPMVTNPGPSGALHFSTASLSVGGGAGVSPFNGTIDEVWITNYARSPSQILDDATLLAFYRFDQTSGSTAFDASGYGRDLLINNSAWAPDRNGGGAFNCSAMPPLGQVAGDPGLNLGDLLQVSVQAWVKFTGPISMTSYELLAKPSGTLSAEYGFGGDSSGGRFYVTPGSDGNAYSALITAATDTSWHQWVGTYDGAQVCGYYDGVLSSPCTIIPTAPKTLAVDPTKPFTVGAFNTGGGMPCYNVEIDDVRIYNRTLTASEVTTLFRTP